MHTTKVQIMLVSPTHIISHMEFVLKKCTSTIQARKLEQKENEQVYTHFFAPTTLL